MAKTIRVCLLCEASSEGTMVTFRRRDICNLCEEDLARRSLAWCALGKHKTAAADMNTTSKCKACHAASVRQRPRDRREYTRAWKERNREYMQDYRRRPDVRAHSRAKLNEWKAANRERSRELQRAYHARHRSTILENKRRRYAINRDRNLAYWRAYYQRRKLRVWFGQKEARRAS